MYLPFQEWPCRSLRSPLLLCQLLWLIAQTIYPFRSPISWIWSLIVWMLQKIFGMVNSVKSQLNSPWKIWTTTPCIIVMWASVGSANYTPKQRTIAILSCHTFRYLQQLQRNLDSLYNNSLMLVGGKTKRCRDNKRDTAVKPGGSGFKNGAESTTNDFKVYSRRPKRFREIKWNCFIRPKELYGKYSKKSFL